ncbi:hypothetical protein EMWEY_00042230 [Eimeria maxima]|uniref:Uncharacterized protein n=1 Tax=Eimeria maxima TaxID=5804 RepID=U6MET7_EIMMA|nr:hypothetical protein EMWEY_00042230 [Eimeria maxima]CDJ61553.1 hypothetical protein EMWEY_00042230 [Eimeria maxima]
MRRLANSDEDEMCLDLLERMETINANGGKISSMPHALWHNQAIRKESGKRKREPSPDNQSEEVEQAKKPSLEEDRRNLSPVLPEDCVPSESSSWLAPPSQPPPESQHEYQGTGGTNSSPHTIDIDPTLNKDESAPWFTVIEDIFTGDEPVEQWFLDYILDPSSTLSPGGGLDQIHGSHEFPHKRAANAVDQLPPSGSPRPERQSSVAHGNAGGDAQLPVREGKDVQVYSDPSAVHPRPKSGLPKLQMHPLSLLVENFSGLHDTPSQVPRFIPPFDKCIIVYEPQPLPGGSLPSTSQVQTPAPMHGLISIDNESLGKHRFFRLPKADCSRKLIPFKGGLVEASYGQDSVIS